MSKHDKGNRADQLNPNNDAYWQSRGQEERPEDWKKRADDEQGESSSESN